MLILTFKPIPKPLINLRLLIHIQFTFQIHQLHTQTIHRRIPTQTPHQLKPSLIIQNLHINTGEKTIQGRILRQSPHRIVQILLHLNRQNLHTSTHHHKSPQIKNHFINIIPHKNPPKLIYRHHALTFIFQMHRTISFHQNRIFRQSLHKNPFTLRRPNLQFQIRLRHNKHTRQLLPQNRIGKIHPLIRKITIRHRHQTLHRLRQNIHPPIAINTQQLLRPIRITAQSAHRLTFSTKKQSLRRILLLRPIAKITAQQRNIQRLRRQLPNLLPRQNLFQRHTHRRLTQTFRRHHHIRQTKTTFRNNLRRRHPIFTAHRIFRKSNQPRSRRRRRKPHQPTIIARR